MNSRKKKKDSVYHGEYCVKESTPLNQTDPYFVYYNIVIIVVVFSLFAETMKEKEERERKKERLRRYYLVTRYFLAFLYISRRYNLVIPLSSQSLGNIIMMMEC